MDHPLSYLDCLHSLGPVLGHMLPKLQFYFEVIAEPLKHFVLVGAVGSKIVSFLL